MNHHIVTFFPANRQISVPEDTTLLQAQIAAGLLPDAPCGGRGSCGKCKVTLSGGRSVLACQTQVSQDLFVYTTQHQTDAILSSGANKFLIPDSRDNYVLAIDIGTTTLVVCLMDGHTGTLLATASCANPQRQFGADVISRIQYVLHEDNGEMQNCLLRALSGLIQQASQSIGISPEAITTAALAGNTAMHHLLLGINPASLVTVPYVPACKNIMDIDAQPFLPISGKLRILPNIAGFVGGDTVACMAAESFDSLDELTLLIDIGTNGEMVLGNTHRQIACSTAAGPAFEGGNISCGMRGTSGAVDHVWLENQNIQFHVIGETDALGLCGSGLLDLTATLLELGIIDETGRMESEEYLLPGTAVRLTQKDIREVQLAKAALRAGIELLTETMGAQVPDIRRVLLAGAFGTYLTPASACRIGLLPPSLLGRTKAIGNAALEGAKRCALSQTEFHRCQALAERIEFLELASVPAFQDRYVDALLFLEEEL